MSNTTNANEFLNSGNYINAKKVSEKQELQMPLIIVDVKLIETSDNKNKLSLVFGGIKETMILNKTNLKVMIDSAGSDYTQWITKTVSLQVIPSTFNGQPTKSVLIATVV